MEGFTQNDLFCEVSLSDNAVIVDSYHHSYQQEFLLVLQRKPVSFRETGFSIRLGSTTQSTVGFAN
jgi:hypothetical protein